MPRTTTAFRGFHHRRCANALLAALQRQLLAGIRMRMHTALHTAWVTALRRCFHASILPSHPCYLHSRRSDRARVSTTWEGWVNPGGIAVQLQRGLHSLRQYRACPLGQNLALQCVVKPLLLFCLSGAGVRCCSCFCSCFSRRCWRHKMCMRCTAHERCVNMSPYLNLPCEYYLRIVWCGTIGFDALNYCTGVNSDPFISLHSLNSAHHALAMPYYFPRAYLMRGHLKAAAAAHLMGCLDLTVRRAR